MKINEFIVVEERDDTERVKRAVECDTIRTNGSVTNRRTLEVVKDAQQSRGVIVLADPDLPEGKTRNTVTEHIKGVKHAYIGREKARNKKGKTGVEHADLIDIKEALMYIGSPFGGAYESIDRSALMELGLIVGKDVRRRREILNRELRTGHSNGKQLLKKLNVFGYAEADIRRALKNE